VMKPKPFASLNHFTRPVGMAVSWLEKGERYHARLLSLARLCCPPAGGTPIPAVGPGEKPLRKPVRPLLSGYLSVYLYL
jgi:hypothetical protein